MIRRPIDHASLASRFPLATRNCQCGLDSGETGHFEFVQRVGSVLRARPVVAGIAGFGSRAPGRDRGVWQLETSQFSLKNADWQPFVAGMVQAVKDEFGIAQKVDAQLDKLLISEPGSFFTAHRDTEKAPGMFGTLVVCLPSPHEGGTLVVTHDGQTRRIDFSGHSAFKVQYAAFYADCQHEKPDEMLVDVLLEDLTVSAWASAPMP